MSRPLFAPTLRQTIVLAMIGLAALAGGFYLRHQVIEQAAVGIACGDGSTSWICAIRHATIALFTPSAFGFTALVAALLNLVRPGLVLCALTLLAGGLGIVLYNVALSALALALLVLSLARPAAASD
jgi:hypothetical protein